ncbi:MAG: MFS transporter, partial [Chloroflexota bacterium]|nr:MFS transporter [Chloroflexota bacterium]
ATMLPYLLFGLIGGALADRSNRKRLMIGADLGRAAVIASIPLLYYFDALPLWWIYGTSFVSTMLRILFDAGEFAAIPSLVPREDLVRANGRIQAVYSAGFVAGPPLAGLAAAYVPVVDVLLLDAMTFVVSAILLAWIRTSFNTEVRGERRKLRSDIAEGLRYVWRNPVLRHISLMMALVNFVTAVQHVQLVLFAKEQLAATNVQFGLLLAGEGVGVIVLSLAAGPLRRRFPFGVVALGALAGWQALVIAFALLPYFWAALALWAVASGLGALFNINTSSLRQEIVPNQLLGRVMSVASVIAWSAIPLGALLGGWVVEAAGVTFAYVASGAIAICIPALFAFSSLGRAERYMAEIPREAEQTFA